MKVLAVDTSSLVASVAIVDDTRLLGEYTINHKKTHSQKIMPMIKELMDNLELAPSDIDVYAASVGPGSFTGLRIGVTTIKSIAYACGKSVVSVPTLDALAYNIPIHEGIICPIMDARNNQVYTALYRREGDTQARVSEYLGIEIVELVKLTKEHKHKAIFLGDGVEVHRQFLKQQLGDKCEFAPAHLLFLRGASVAQLALKLALEGLVENCYSMSPFYLRKSQAEREYEKRQTVCEC